MGLTRFRLLSLVLALSTTAFGPAALAADALPKSLPARVDVLPITSLTLSDEQFLKGQQDGGRAVTIAGTLRIAQGDGRLPVVVFVAGSGGFSGGNPATWDAEFLQMGVSTFTLDGYSARGITSLVTDQSQLGRLNMIVDVYRALGVLGGHPRVDPSRIAVMGFSRGGQVVVYASMRRFQTMWNSSGIDPAAYIALYPSCVTTYIGDTDVSDHPIRMFHGVSDDYVQIAPCRAYVDRLQLAHKDVGLTEFENTWHAFDYPLLPSEPTIVRNAQSTRCVLQEEPAGTIMNTATRKPFSYGDACVVRDPHVAYSPSATRATEGAVKELLARVFRLN